MPVGSRLQRGIPTYTFQTLTEQEDVDVEKEQISGLFRDCAEALLPPNRH